MNYKRILRLGSTVVETVEPEDMDCNYLTSEEVAYLMTEFKRLQEEYFPDVPISSSLKHAKRFLYNIPRNVYNLIMKVEESDVNEVVSPLFMIYPLLATGLGISTQKMYLERLSYSISNKDDEEEVDDDE